MTTIDRAVLAQSLLSLSKPGSGFAPSDAFELLTATKTENNDAFDAKIATLLNGQIPDKVRALIEENTGQSGTLDKEARHKSFVRAAMTGSHAEIDYPEEPEDDELESAEDEDGVLLDFGDENEAQPEPVEEKVLSVNEKIGQAFVASIQRCSVASGQQRPIAQMLNDIQKAVSKKSLSDLAVLFHTNSHTIAQVLPRMSIDEHLFKELDAIEDGGKNVERAKFIVNDIRQALSDGRDPGHVVASAFLMVTLMEDDTE
jgi:hypothetical protein